MRRLDRVGGPRWSGPSVSRMMARAAVGSGGAGLRRSRPALRAVERAGLALVRSLRIPVAQVELRRRGILSFSDTRMPAPTAVPRCSWKRSMAPTMSLLCSWSAVAPRRSCPRRTRRRPSLLDGRSLTNAFGGRPLRRAASDSFDVGRAHAPETSIADDRLVLRRQQHHRLRRATATTTSVSEIRNSVGGTWRRKRWSAPRCPQRTIASAA